MSSEEQQARRIIYRSPTYKTLGILGGGQLAQMLALAALPLGVRVKVLEPDPEAPARLCAEHICAPYTDAAGLAELAKCDAVTLEFENVPVEALQTLAGKVPVAPSQELLHKSKHRAREKMSLQQAGAQTARFVVLDKAAPEQPDLAAALAEVGGGGLLKTSELGYDGKGQRVIECLEDLEEAWEMLGGVPCVLEEFVPFIDEVSIGVARNASGQIAFGPLIENLHRFGILWISVFGGFFQRTPKHVIKQARQLAGQIAEAWNLEGLMTIEFFVLRSGELVVNEVAPRVHNSGHLTQDGGGVSQFEMQVRAVLDLPIADWEPLLPCAMFNLVGFDDGEYTRCTTDRDSAVPHWEDIESVAGTRIHLYHKDYRRGRKLGHVNVVAPNATELRKRMTELEQYIP